MLNSAGRCPVSCRLEWPKDHYFPPCVLKFRDGWEPPALPSTPSRERELTQLAESLSAADVQRHEELSSRLAQEVCTCRHTPLPPEASCDASFTSCLCCSLWWCRSSLLQTGTPSPTPPTNACRSWIRTRPWLLLNRPSAAASTGNSEVT